MKTVVLVTTILATSCATTNVDDYAPCVVGAAFAAGVCAIPVIAIGGSLWARPDGEVPGYGMRQEDGQYPGADVALALDTFLREWQRRFGDVKKIKDVFNRMDVIWEQRPFMDDYGEHSAGYMDWIGSNEVLARGRVRLAWMPDVPLSKTALVHELVHAALQVTEGDVDYNHGKAPGPWTVEIDLFIDDVNAEIESALEKDHG